MPAAPQKHLTSIFFATTQESQSFFFFPSYFQFPVGGKKTSQLRNFFSRTLGSIRRIFSLSSAPNDLSKEVPLLLSPYTVLPVYCRIFFSGRWGEKETVLIYIYFLSFPFPRCLAYLLISSPLRCQQKFFSLTLLSLIFSSRNFPPRVCTGKKEF